jgi:hypothetical protein
MPLSAAASAWRRAVATGIELITIRRLPARMVARTPPSMSVSSQTGPELNMQTTASAPRPAAAASLACATPKAESASALAGVRFQAATSCPAWAMRRAMWPPMMPVPRKPIDNRRAVSMQPGSLTTAAGVADEDTVAALRPSRSLGDRRSPGPFHLAP